MMAQRWETGRQHGVLMSKTEKLYGYPVTLGDIHVVKKMAGYVPNEKIAMALKIPLSVVKRVRKVHKV